MKVITELLTIDELEVQVSYKPIKNIYLRICHQTGLVRLSVPKTYKPAQIDKFIRAKRSWLDKHKQTINLQPQPRDFSYTTGEKHSYQGQSYTLIIDHNSSVNRVTCDKQQQQITLFTKSEISLEKRAKLLQEWYRTQFKEQLPTLINKWEETIGVTSEDWGIKQMKSRWGTCNTKTKKIWLNLELIKKPTICLEYVLVHELVHLLERKHNKRFYAYMNQFMPEWKTHDEQLKNS